jgi:hypothetical protein
MGSNGRPGPPPFRRPYFRVTKSFLSWHHVRVWPRRVNSDTSIATTCHHHNDDYANARTERKTSNREHLRAFSFYFHTSRYCNLTPPFAYYKRGGRDPRQNDGETMPSNGNVLRAHSNTRTHPLIETWELSLSRSACIPLLQALRCKATRAAASTGCRDVQPEPV